MPADNANAGRIRYCPVCYLVNKMEIPMELRRTSYGYDYLYVEVLNNYTYKIYNLTLYLWRNDGGGWVINQTINVNFTINNSYNFTGLSGGSFHLNASGSNTYWTQYLDSTGKFIPNAPPVISFVPVTTNDTVNQNWLSINITITDINIDHTSLKVWHDGIEYYAHNFTGASQAFNLTNLNRGNYTYNATTYDTGGLSASIADWAEIEYYKTLKIGIILALWGYTLPDNWCFPISGDESFCFGQSYGWTGNIARNYTDRDCIDTFRYGLLENTSHQNMG